ncbi:MAG: hypothetical protein ACRCZF_17265 [Gemmataceae bacterium]
MARITLPDDLVRLLKEATEASVLYDSQGKIVGQFVPRDLAYDEAPELTPEELERRKASTKWHTTQEVLKYLEAL